jgi:hypothetical protein
MWTAMIEGFYVHFDHSLGMGPVQGEYMIQALTPHTTEKAFPQRIGPKGRLEQFEMSAYDGSFKQQPILVIVVTNKERGPAPKGVSSRIC